MKRKAGRNALAFGVALLALECGGGNHDGMLGPNGTSAIATGATLMAVTPQGGATRVPVTSRVVLRFEAAMGA